MSALAQTIETPATRAQFVERIKAAWHKSRERILALGNALIEAKRALSPEDFAEMIASDLPFGADQARRFMRISADPRLSARETSHVLPGTVDAMDTLQRLTDEQFEAAIGSGAVHAKMTVKDARAIVSDFKAQTGFDAPAPFAIGNVTKLHRPGATKCGPPTSPAGASANTWPEMVWMLTQRRKSLGIPQLVLDERCGWSEGQTSKYEIPHADDGRFPGAEALCEWLQALKLGVALVPLS